MRSLKALGVEPESYGAMLSSVLLSEVPPEIRLIVSRKVSTKNLDMDCLSLQMFEQELMAREGANNSVSQPSRSQGRPLPTFPNSASLCIL